MPTGDAMTIDADALRKALDRLEARINRSERATLRTEDIAQACTAARAHLATLEDDEEFGPVTLHDEDLVPIASLAAPVEARGERRPATEEVLDEALALLADIRERMASWEAPNRLSEAQEQLALDGRIAALLAKRRTP